jgi:hypothetical protein
VGAVITVLLIAADNSRMNGASVNGAKTQGGGNKLFFSALCAVFQC